MNQEALFLQGRGGSHFLKSAGACNYAIRYSIFTASAPDQSDVVPLLSIAVAFT